MPMKIPWYRSLVNGGLLSIITGAQAGRRKSRVNGYSALLSAGGMARPGVHDVKDQRRVHRYIRMQAGRRLPGAVADPGDKLAPFTAGIERYPSAVAQYYKARID